MRKRNAGNDRRLERWKKHHVDLEHPASPDEELVKGCTGFLEAWKARNYGVLGVVLSQLHEQDSRRAGWRGERALSSPSDRGIRDRGDCQARRRSRQRKDTVPHFGQIVGRVDPSSRLDGTALAADWEPGAWKVMGYGVAPSLTRWRTGCRVMLLQPDKRRRAAHPRWCRKAEEVPGGLI